MHYYVLHVSMNCYSATTDNEINSFVTPSLKYSSKPLINVIQLFVLHNSKSSILRGLEL